MAKLRYPTSRLELNHVSKGPTGPGNSKGNFNGRSAASLGSVPKSRKDSLGKPIVASGKVKPHLGKGNVDVETQDASKRANSISTKYRLSSDGVVKR